MPDIDSQWTAPTKVFPTANCGYKPLTRTVEPSANCSSATPMRSTSTIFGGRPHGRRAEELTSVVFLEAWRHRQSVRLDTDSILPWLLAVANNVIRNANRSLRRHQRLLAKLPRPLQADDFGDDAAGRLDDEREMGHVLSLLEALRAEEQEVVALCDWAGLSYTQAATALDVPVGTVRSRLSRAHEHLRARLGETAENPHPVAPVLQHPEGET